MISAIHFITVIAIGLFLKSLEILTNLYPEKNKQVISSQTFED